MVCAEMVSANALHYKDETSLRMLQTFPDEHPVSLQLFGNDPSRLADAAKRAEAAGADVVDLNCGCPVPKVTKTGAGVSLMKEESLFSHCLESMVKAVKIPVTVKMRLGFVRGQNEAVRFSRLAESVGVGAVSVHARAQEDRHSGPPHLEALAETVAAVKIPVFGNGGINTRADAEHMMAATGCAGVLIGQAAIGNPFLFREFLHGEPLPTQRLALLREHAHRIVDYYGENLGIRRLRKHLASYVRDLPHAATFRGQAFQTTTLSEFLSVVDEFDSRGAL
jgi:nifR3 family TIM-barrel protein